MAHSPEKLVRDKIRHIERAVDRKQDKAAAIEGVCLRAEKRLDKWHGLSSVFVTAWTQSLALICFALIYGDKTVQEPLMDRMYMMLPGLPSDRADLIRRQLVLIGHHEPHRQFMTEQRSYDYERFSTWLNQLDPSQVREYLQNDGFAAAFQQCRYKSSYFREKTQHFLTSLPSIGA